MQTFACIAENITKVTRMGAYFLRLPRMLCIQCATARSILTVEKTENSLVVTAYFYFHA